MASDPSFESADYEESKNVKKFDDENSIENTNHELANDIAKEFVPSFTVIKVLKFFFNIYIKFCFLHIIILIVLI